MDGNDRALNESNKDSDEMTIEFCVEYCHEEGNVYCRLRTNSLSSGVMILWLADNSFIF